MLPSVSLSICQSLFFVAVIVCICIAPVVPPGGSGETSSWSDCDAYNTVGLQWCCSSSLTLLAPPTGPPTTKPRYSASWAPPLPRPVAVRQRVGDPWGDGDHGGPFEDGQSPSCASPSHLSACGCCCCRIRGGQMVADLKACVLLQDPLLWHESLQRADSLFLRLSFLLNPKTLFFNFNMQQIVVTTF